MDTKVKGIILKTKDYNESDKLLTILTLEKGKILVKARGVKKQSSKLKAFCQSFCFADFELASSKAGFILTGVREVESFYDITLDLEKFKFAFCALELVDKICLESQTYSNIFIDLLKFLQEINFGSSNPSLLLSKFIYSVLSYEGYKFNLDKCSGCSTTLNNDLFIDLSQGEILCRACKNFNCVELEKSIFQILKIISRCSFQELKTVKLNNTLENKVLNFFLENLKLRYDLTLKSLKL